MKVEIELDGMRCLVEYDGNTLSDVLELCEQALRGVGFIVEGSLDIVDDSARDFYIPNKE